MLLTGLPFFGSMIHPTNSYIYTCLEKYTRINLFIHKNPRYIPPKYIPQKTEYMSNKPISRLLFCLFWGFCLLLTIQPIYGQDLGFSYQAIARNNNGDPITSQNLTVTIQLRRSSANGSIAYQEEHSVQTNALGLFTLTIGEGNATTGSFNSLAWGGNTYFVVVGINGNSIGGTRLEAVPYSKVATHMDLQDLLDVDNGTPASGQVLTWNGSEWEAQNAQSGFSPVAGDGIQINGNTITNTGDTNPNNDITNSSQAGGDLSGNFGDLNIRNNTIGTGNIVDGSITENDISSGTEIPGPPTGGAGQDLRGNYPNPFVSGIQGRPVQNTTPTNGEVLTWDSSVSGGSWTPKPVESSGGDPTGNVGGDLNGTLPNPTVDGLQGRPVLNIQPSINQVLTWTGTQWAPGNFQVGAANGDVSGTYPSLTVEGLQGNIVSSNNPSLDQVLTWNGAAWIPADAPTDAESLQGQPISPSSTPLDQQVLTWNQAANHWEPQTVTGGGSSNATQLQSRNIAATLPGAGQVLAWNAVSEVWEPQTVSGGGSGDATSIQGRPVDATQPSSGQVLLWVGGVDGDWVPSPIPPSTPGNADGDVTGAYDALTVGKIQGRDIAPDAPSDLQVLTWNQGLAQWEPQTVTGGGSGNATQIQSRNVAATAPTSNQVLAWNQGLAQWEPQTVTGGGSGDATSIQGRPVDATQPSSGQVLLWVGGVDGDWVPSPIPPSTPGNADGDVTGAYDALTVGKIQGRDIAPDAPSDLQVLTWNQGLAQWEPQTVTGGGSGNATQIQSRNVAATAPTSNQVLAWNQGLAQWEPQTVSGGGSGDATSIQGHSVDATQPTAGQVLLWVGGATGDWVPSAIPPSTPGNADGDVTGAYDALTVGKIQGRDIAPDAPSDLQVLTWNQGLAQWEPQTVTGGGSGNATQIQSRNVAATAPTSNQVLAWNQGLAQWEPQTVSGGGSGDATSIQGHSVDATQPTAGQVLLWVGGATGDWVPSAIPPSTPGNADGDVTGTYDALTVEKIQGRDIAPDAPSDLQVLTWNQSLTQWEPQTVSGGGSGDATSIQGHSVDATQPTAGQVLLWVGGATGDWVPSAIPPSTPGNADGDVTGAYDALVVEKLRGQDISTTAPSAVDQVLTWNGSEWAPKTFASLVSSGNFSNFSASNSSPLLRQTQSTQTLTLAPNSGQDILSLAIPTTEKACALITIGGEASIQEGAGGGYANLEYGLRDNASLQSPVSHATLAIPEGYPSGASFFHNLYFSRLVAIPAGGTTVTAFAQNSPNGESISLDNLSMVAQIITDESNNCNE